MLAGRGQPNCPALLWTRVQPAVVRFVVDECRRFHLGGARKRVPIGDVESPSVMAAKRTENARRAEEASNKRRKSSTATVATTDAASPRTLRIERPYGGAVIFETVSDDADAVTTYFAFVTSWFAERGSQLPLLDDGTEGPRELAAAHEAANSPEWLSPPAQVTMRYESATPRSVRPNLPPPIAGDTYPTTPGIERRSVSTYVIARPDERFETSTGLAVRHTEKDGTAQVEMRPVDGQLTDEAVTEIRNVAAQLSAVDDDVLDVLLANAIAHGHDGEGLYTIEIDAIIDTRQRGVKHKSESGKSYLSGRRQETRDETVERLQRLQTLYVSIGERKMRGKMVREYDQVLNIPRIITDPGNKERVIAVRYSFGKWFRAWRDGHAVAPRRLLELDGRNGAPAKVLGRYFIQRALEADSQDRIVRNVRELLRDLRRNLPDDAGKNSGRPRVLLEEHLDTLEREGVLASWGYLEANGKRVDAMLGSGYKKTMVWLDLHIFVVLAPEATASRS
jgi:hypothetical protein